MQDALLTFTSIGTAGVVTATGQSAALTLSTGSLTGTGLTGTPRRGLVAVVDYSAATNASGANNVLFKIQHSPDTTNWYDLAFPLENPAGSGTNGIALSTTAQQGVLNIPFSCDSPQVRLAYVVSGAGSTPTITATAGISLARPN